MFGFVFRSLPTIPIGFPLSSSVLQTSSQVASPGTSRCGLLCPPLCPPVVVRGCVPLDSASSSLSSHMLCLFHLSRRFAVSESYPIVFKHLCVCSGTGCGCRPPSMISCSGFGRFDSSPFPSTSPSVTLGSLSVYLPFPAGFARLARFSFLA